ncbi:MAG: apolipoprotein N-acyltransferase, partial [Gammaproteobacteria bacterium]
LGSVFLVSGVIALFVELLILGLGRPQRGLNIVPLAGSFGLLMVTVWVSSIQWAEPRGVLAVAAVQGNLDQRTKWQSHQFDANFERHWQPTLGLSEADLVVWPEASFTDFKKNRSQLLQSMDAAVSERGQGLIIGLPDRNESGYTNTALGLGEVDGSYAKRHLVPFGEYVPLEHWLRGVIAFFDLPMSRNQPGPSVQAPLSFKGQPLSLSICYEIAYPHLVRSAAKEPMALVTISNDTWFGDSIGPVQHLQIAQMRALENGRGLLRVTNNGITAAIDHAGEITDLLPRNQQGVLRTELVLVSGDTPYHRLGYGVLGAVLLFGFLLNVAASRWRRE